MCLLLLAGKVGAGLLADVWESGSEATGLGCTPFSLLAGNYGNAAGIGDGGVLWCSDDLQEILPLGGNADRSEYGDVRRLFYVRGGASG